MVLVDQPDRHVTARTVITPVFTLLVVPFQFFSCQAAAAPNKTMEPGSDQLDVS